MHKNISSLFFNITLIVIQGEFQVHYFQSVAFF